MEKIKKIVCRCGQIIEPPEIIPPTVHTGSGFQYQTQVIIKYVCPNADCRKSYTTDYNFTLEVKIRE